MLPIEVVVRYGEERFPRLPAARPHLERLAAQMHVGGDGQESAPFGKSLQLGADLVIGGVRGDLEVLIDRGERHDLVGDLLARHRHDADARQIVTLATVGGVVHLEDELRPGGDPSGMPRWEGGGPLAGHVGGDEAHALEIGEVLGANEDDSMVDDRRGARHTLRRRDPRLVREVRIGDEVLVVDGARGRHGVGPAPERHDRVRRSRQAPAINQRRRRRALARIAGRHPRLEPRLEQRRRRSGELAGVLEAAVIRGGVPGGHPLLLHRLEHHRRPAAHLIDRRDIEGADLTAAVAFEAMRLKERDDVSMEGRGGLGGQIAVAVERDQAADRFGARHGDRAAGEEIVEGGGEFVGRRGGAGEAGGELIVDPAGIGNASERVEDHDPTGAGGAERAGDPLTGIHHERERHPGLPGCRQELVG